MHTSFKIDDSWKNRILNLTSGSETVSLFCYKAMEEKVKRMESRDERAKLQLKEKTTKLISPIVKEIVSGMKERGEL